MIYAGEVFAPSLVKEGHPRGGDLDEQLREHRRVYRGRMNAVHYERLLEWHWELIDAWWSVEGG